jgi:hypothetical protein
MVGLVGEIVRALAEMSIRLSLSGKGFHGSSYGRGRPKYSVSTSNWFQTDPDSGTNAKHEDSFTVLSAIRSSYPAMTLWGRRPEDLQRRLDHRMYVADSGSFTRCISLTDLPVIMAAAALWEARL